VPRVQPPVRPRARLKKNRFGLTVDDETSARLGRVRQKGTSPEQAVSALLRSLGIRYRLSNRELPGSPDIANRSKRWAVFVNGCFWHRHKGCSRATTPKRNRAFWMAKFHANVRRDKASTEALRTAGYRTVVVWECEIEQDPRRVLRLLARRILRPA
jgi:DNA mismatch endonuclease (patch repair protein)